jgi:hypothetical protein
MAAETKPKIYEIVCDGPTGCGWRVHSQVEEVCQDKYAVHMKTCPGPRENWPEPEATE